MFRRIMLAVDRSAAGPVAGSFAIALARGWGASVDVVSVSSSSQLFRARDYERTGDAIRRVAAEVKDAGIPVRLYTFTSSRPFVARTIAEAVRRLSPDVLILGSLRTASLRLPHFSVRERVTRLVSVPVFVAPAPLEAGELDFLGTIAPAPAPRSQAS